MESIDRSNAAALKIKMLICILLALALAFSLSLCSDPLAYAAVPGTATAAVCGGSVKVMSGDGYEAPQNEDGTPLEALHNSIK